MLDKCLTCEGHWDEQYRRRHLPWETGRPSSELRRLLKCHRIAHCRSLELGCGTGINAVWLALQGFEVTALDISGPAIRRARRRARRHQVGVAFIKADVRTLAPPGYFDFFFDRGCYHAVRLEPDGVGYLRTLRRVTRPGALGIILSGNAREPEDEAGPPVLTETEIRDDFGAAFHIVQMREFYFDAVWPGGKRYLGWSCLLRRR